jgi:hypothetical protein
VHKSARASADEDAVAPVHIPRGTVPLFHERFMRGDERFFFFMNRRLHCAAVA